MLAGQVSEQDPAPPPPATAADAAAELSAVFLSLVVALEMLTVLSIDVPDGVPAFTV
jgi:hypothetical protein